MGTNKTKENKAKRDLIDNANMHTMSPKYKARSFGDLCTRPPAAKMVITDLSRAKEYSDMLFLK